jgi:hypothetical protein
MQDEDVQQKKGIYYYVLDGKEKHLNIRQFSPNMRREAYERQKGICPVEKKAFRDRGNGSRSHYTLAWGGKTTAENCQMLCKEANRRKAENEKC